MNEYPERPYYLGAAIFIGTGFLVSLAAGDSLVDLPFTVIGAVLAVVGEVIRRRRRRRK